MDKIFDLPAHPMFVHFPIALAPIVVLGVIATVALPAWRRPLGPYLVGGSLVSLVSLFLARQSGEEMFELLDREPSIAKHEDLATQSVILWLLFVVVLIATVVVHRRSTASAGSPRELGSVSAGSPRELGSVSAGSARELGSVPAGSPREAGAPASAGTLRTVAAALALATVALGVVSTVWIARTGHEGAKSHWSFVNQS